MFDYKLVRALAMVVREGGFEKAAQALHLTQSAVSQRVRLLEDQAGQALLVRSQPPRTTPAGTEVLKHYRRVEMLEGDLERALVPDGEARRTLAVGVNADSLATWFLGAVAAVHRDEDALLDVHVADQEKTHQLLRRGEVVGCVSARAEPMQGCSAVGLGCMVYRLTANPSFAARWFPQGMSAETATTAPAVIFDRNDNTHAAMLERAFGVLPGRIPNHFIPSSEGFVSAVVSGLGYGMVPDLQADPLIERGELVDLGERFALPVDLYWHCWNIDSSLLTRFTKALVGHARDTLVQSASARPGPGQG